jgi:hypothetical protein
MVKFDYIKIFSLTNSVGYAKAHYYLLEVTAHAM